MKTKVVFKKIYWFNGENPIVEINAIFPEEIESVVNGETIYMGYAHIGQHGGTHEDFLNKDEVGVHKVKNASYNDYKDLALELEQIGYELEILN
jgi:hypothetical protein